MSDERAVQQVLAKYVRGADARDGAAVAALFTETGRVEIMKNTVSRLAQE
ncbi:MAG TPA: nuclear transport factor 2 family protein [Candidatus Sulfotelmatobacter sp.]